MGGCCFFGSQSAWGAAFCDPSVWRCGQKVFYDGGHEGGGGGEEL